MTSPHPNGTSSSSPPTIIIDTDPGIDDVLAILLALATPRVNLAAITLTFGNTTVAHGRNNILRTFATLQKACQEDEGVKKMYGHLFEERSRGTIALTEGAQGPLGGRLFHAAYFHGPDGLSSISSLNPCPFPVPTSTPSTLTLSDTSSADKILDILSSHPANTVGIAAIGPLTNLALAWRKDPKTFARVNMISVMGGALDVPGNTSPTAEFNFFADPWAARVLLQEAPSKGYSLPLHILPLDITHQHKVPYSALCDGEGASRNSLRKFMSLILARPRSVTNSFAPHATPPSSLAGSEYDDFVAHDPLAVAHLLSVISGSHPSHAVSASDDPDSIQSGKGQWVTRRRRFGVETEGRLTRGMCVVDRRAGAHKEEGSNRAEVEEKRSKPLNAKGTPSGASLGNGAGGEKEEVHPGGGQTVEGVAPTDVDEEGQQTHHGDEDHSDEVPDSGEADVVIASPLTGKWFEETFGRALGL